MSQSMIERAKRSSSSCDAGAGAGASAGAVGFMALLAAAGWNTWGGGHVRVCGMNRFSENKSGAIFLLGDLRSFNLGGCFRAAVFGASPGRKPTRRKGTEKRGSPGGKRKPGLGLEAPLASPRV